MQRLSLSLFVALVCLFARSASAAESTTVYKRVGPDGVVTFSDQAEEGAEAIEIEMAAPRADDVARAGEMMRQQLEVADALEQSRRADEAAREKAREYDLAVARAEAARAAAEASQVYDDDEYVWAPWYSPGYPGWGPWRPGHDRPGHDRPGHEGPGHGGPGDDRPGDGRPGRGHPSPPPKPLGDFAP
jgi:hypothetical protein